MRRMYSKSQIEKIIDEHGGGGGAVNSVNGKTGTVVLKASDINANNAQTIQNNLERLDTRIDDLAYITDVGDGLDLTDGLLSADFDDVQPKLTAGANITITGNVISATAGEDRGVSDVVVDGESVVEDGVATIDLSTKLDATKSAVSSVGGLVVPTVAPANTRLVAVDTTNAQAQITIGSGLSLTGSTSPYTLSATGSTYTAGFGIDITGNEISAKCGKGIMTNTQGKLTIRRSLGLKYDAYDALEPDYDYVQRKLTAGANIYIDPNTNVISASGGEGVVTDVKVNNTSVVDGYGVANIPKAAAQVLGVVGVKPGYGIAINNDGFIYCNEATSTDLISEGAYMPITSHNYVAAMREGFYHNTTWTSQDKNAARQCIEASKVARKTTSTATDTIDYISIDNIDYKIPDTKYTAGSGITLNGTTFSTIIPAAPTSDGNYVLKVSVVSGVATYSWVKETQFGLSGTTLNITQ